ncbi:MAG: TetR/AcrR family transcriptional regulator [Sphingomonas sp.]|nr:TetR/AcrR family transcriptional regulator [Sphingomonas sp.]
MSGKSMPKGEIDRRVRRTRDALQGALISLILEKGYDALTIEEICAAANVGRSTFYAHYTSRDDLKRSAIDEHVRTLFRQLADPHPGDAGQPPVSPTLAIFEHARDHRHFCKAVVRGSGGTLAIDTIQAALADQMRHEIEELGLRGPGGAFLREFSVRYRVGAFMSLLTWWIEGGAKHPAEEMERLFRKLSNHGALSLS